MKSFDEIVSEWDIDSEMSGDIAKEVLLLSRKHSKYLRYLSAYKMKLMKLRAEMDSMVCEKTEYYSGNADASAYKNKPFSLKLTTKEAVNKYVTADSEIAGCRLQIDYNRDVIECIEAILKHITSMGHNLRTALDSKKFDAGA